MPLINPARQFVIIGKSGKAPGYAGPYDVVDSILPYDVYFLGNHLLWRSPPPYEKRGESSMELF